MASPRASAPPLRAVERLAVERARLVVERPVDLVERPVDLVERPVDLVERVERLVDDPDRDEADLDELDRLEPERLPEPLPLAFVVERERVPRDDDEPEPLEPELPRLACGIDTSPCLVGVNWPGPYCFSAEGDNGARARCPEPSVTTVTGDTRKNG